MINKLYCIKFRILQVWTCSKLVTQCSNWIDLSISCILPEVSLSNHQTISTIELNQLTITIIAVRNKSTQDTKTKQMNKLKNNSERHLINSFVLSKKHAQTIVFLTKKDKYNQNQLTNLF